MHLTQDLIALMANSTTARRCSIGTPTLAGAVNATAPEPVCNAEFTRALGRALRRPAVARVTAAVLRLLGGRLAEELPLAGQCVLPAKAPGSGFVFCHRALPQAFAAILGTAPPLGMVPSTSLVGKWLT